MSLVVEISCYICVCVIVFMLRPLKCLQVIRVGVVAGHQQSGKHPAPDMPLLFPSPGTNTPVGLFFQRHPSPFSNIKVAFERAIRTEGEPFM